MARLIRPLRKALLFSSSSPHFEVLALQLQQQPLLQFAEEKPLSFFKLSPYSTRTYITEMRKSAFEGNILRLLRNEIQYEIERFPPHQPVTTFNSFIVDERPGEQWISLKRNYGENEDIKAEVTMFDGAVPGPNAGSGGVGDHLLHITMVVNISKKGGNVLEIMCSVWPDSIEIDKLFIKKRENMPAQPYAGPEFKELDDELQETLYEFLEVRGITDELAVFLHEYMRNKDKAEFIRWMGTLKSFIEKK